MSKVFEVSHLSYRYPKSEKPAVDDVSFCVEKGKFISIVGSNGSGKSTLLKILAGITKPESGELKKSCEFSALVFQNSDNQFVSDVVEEDVAFGPENLCLPTEKIREIVDTSLEKVGMSSYKRRMISTLSEGEKQRVAIAGALALSADVLILDEPASMLNSKEASDIYNLILQLNENGVTVICATQDINLALMSDLIIKMNDGKVENSIKSKDFLVGLKETKECTFFLPEHLKLVKLLIENGVEIDVKHLEPSSIAEACEKL